MFYEPLCYGLYNWELNTKNKNITARYYLEDTSGQRQIRLPREIVLLSHSVMSDSLWHQGLQPVPVPYQLPYQLPEFTQLTSIKSVMPSNHLILYSPLLLPPSVFPSIRVFSWQIDGETVETVTDFILGTSKTTTDGDCSHEIKRWVLTGRKVMTNLDSILKRRDITLPTKVRLVSSVQFSRSVISDSF